MKPTAFFSVLKMLVGLLLVSQPALAEPPAATSGKKPTLNRTDATKPAAAKATFVEFELLQTDNGAGLHAQQWLKILGPLDVTFRIHRPNSNEKLEMRERMVGNLRYVTAVGTLDRMGKITFTDRSFAMADTEKLKDWIEELRTYGIRGNPSGQPVWGLTKEQFAEFFESMTVPIKFDTDELPLKQLIAKLPLPKSAPLHWTADANELVEKRGDRTKMRLELNGFSAGTVLAVALGQNGLAFRPNRVASGEMELLIELKNPKQDQWPVGWPVQRQTSKALPKFHAMVPVELTDVPLADVINAIGQLSETPILIDYAELESRQIDLDKINVSFPRKITTWGIALHRLVVPQKLTREFWQDEAGRVFVWITTAAAGRAKDAESTNP